MGKILKSTIGAAVFAGISGLVLWSLVEARAENGERQGEVGKGGELSRSARGPKALGGVTVEPDAQARIGLVAVPLVAVTRQAQVVAYGTLQADPARSFVLRAPVPGVLVQAESRKWPDVGESLDGRLTVGLLRPRLNPLERVDLGTRLEDAKGQVSELTASLRSAQASFESKKKLSDENHVVSELSLREAESKLKGLEARLRATTQTAHVLQDSLAGNTGPEGPLPLIVPRRGEVVEVLAQPGESVEAGQSLLRVASFDRLIARVELPIGVQVGARPSAATIAPIGYEDRPLRADRIGLAPTVGSVTRGQGLLASVSAAGMALRPGQSVTAYVDLPGKPLAGVAVARGAVIRFEGKAWVYLQMGASTFARRQIALDHATPEGWIVTSGLSPGGRIVVRGAQMLLSEELKPLSGGEEEE
ncbi:MAG: HlyD family efflux transporter periplasmic adaptor subunit [Phycisphaerae bacterium]|nr:HlyD family efflux transporter periplasmic adaptor subunit [Phycisphaerae bacterium]